VNPTVGDLAGNADLLVDVARRAAAAGARLVVFPELSLTGYPPRDLVEKPSFVERTEEQLQRLARETADLDASLICGYVGRTAAQTGKTVTNSAAVIERGEVVFRQSKMLLPILPARRAAILVPHPGPDGRADNLRRCLE
jgi:predicted amidohydrolase